MAGIHITDIEAAINYWREQSPSPDGVTLAPELRALAEVYALMVFYHEDEADEAAFPPEAWPPGSPGTTPRPTRPASRSAPPARATTVCKGCGRSFDEVQHWPDMSPAEKRHDLAPHHAWRTRPGASTAMPNARRRAESARADLSAACGDRRPQRHATGRRGLRRTDPRHAAPGPAPNIAIATLWVDVLREAGSTASVQREFLGGAAGDLPPDQCLPEIWLDGRGAGAPARAPAARRCRTCRSGAGIACAANWSKAASSSAGAAACRGRCEDSDCY